MAQKVNAVLIQRYDDYHISLKNNTGIWDRGKTVTQAIKQFKKLLSSFDMELGRLEVLYDTFKW